MSFLQSLFKKPAWMVVLITLILLVAIGFYFQNHVDQIDHKLEKLKTND